MLVAFHKTAITKPVIMKQLRAHARADEFVKGRYWQDGKGCAVGCTIYSGQHVEYEKRFGVPQMLARLEDRIFEGLPNDKAKAWPVRFMAAIEPGADLSLVGWQFLHWLLTDEKVNPGINHPLVRDAIKQCADVLIPLTKGLPVDAAKAWSAAWSAARAAESAAESAAWSAAESAAWSAARAAESASAARAAEAAWSAARAAESASAARAAEAAESAAESAAWSAAESAARAAAYVRMAGKLISLIKAAPKARGVRLRR